jgi:hypothetical protein
MQLAEWRQQFELQLNENFRNAREALGLSQKDCRSRREGEAVRTRHMATIRANLQDARSRR